MKNIAIILAAGTGSRMKSHVPKQFKKLGNHTILELAIRPFYENKYTDEIIVVTHPKYLRTTKNLLETSGIQKIVKIVEGGSLRHESSYAALSAIIDDDAKVLIHDSARPLVSQTIINQSILHLDHYHAVTPAIPVSDSLLEISQTGEILNFPDRSHFLQLQTPQSFRLKAILEAYQLYRKDKTFEATDDCSVFKKYGKGEIKLIAGDITNLKITTSVDFELAKILFRKSTDRK